MQCRTQQKNGVILHPGAIGDCLLTLPLAAYMKKTFGLVRLDFIGKSEYIDFYPGRTCIDRVRPMESIELHRLFEDSAVFDLADKDRLPEAFTDHEQVVSFFGEGHPFFENNLLFTIHSTHSADVVILSPAAPPDYPAHITDFYFQQFQKEHHLEDPHPEFNSEPWVLPLSSDYAAGRELLEGTGINPDQPIVLIHPGSGSQTKSWHWENFIETAIELKVKNVQPVFLLGPAEQERFPQIVTRLRLHQSVLENLSLTQVLQILTQADVFLGNDSGISHLSANMGKRTIVLFGSSNPVHYRPLGPLVILLTPSAASFAEPDVAECQKVVQTVLQML